MDRADAPGARIAPAAAKKVYRLPDFVLFSHSRHKDAKVECAACHGDVAVIGRVEAVFRATNMKACVDCHKSRNATVVCTACHELGQ